jgi:hypothetical protein
MRTLHDQIREHLDLLAQRYRLSIGSMETKTLNGATTLQDPLQPEIMVTLKIYGRRPREDEMTTAQLEAQLTLGTQRFVELQPRPTCSTPGCERAATEQLETTFHLDGGASATMLEWFCPRCAAERKAHHQGTIDQCKGDEE